MGRLTDSLNATTAASKLTAQRAALQAQMQKLDAEMEKSNAELDRHMAEAASLIETIGEGLKLAEKEIQDLDADIKATFG